MTISAFGTGNQEGGISYGNSTSTPIAAGATFTGTTDECDGYESIVVAVKTDQNGTFTIQFSTDGENWDSTLTRYYRTAQIEPPHRFTVTRRYFRITFTNTSVSDQTYIRLQTSVGNKTALNAPSDSVLSQDYDATVVRPTDFHYEVACGRRQGYTTWNKWGYNDDIDVGTETVWAPGGTFSRMTAADTLNVVSSSTDDDGSPAGIGAQSIILYGVNANYEYQTEVVTLNGTGDVTTSNSWLGINRASIYLAGSSASNVGTITITRTTGGSVQTNIPSGAGSSQHAYFFVQANHTALMDWLLLNALKVSLGTEPLVTFKCWVTSLVSGAKYEVFRHRIDTLVENTIELRPSQPFVVGEKSLVEFQVTTDKADTAASVRFSLIEVRDVDA